MSRRQKPTGHEHPAQQSQTCGTCGQLITARSKADLASAMANHMARHNAKRTGGRR